MTPSIPEPANGSPEYSQILKDSAGIYASSLLRTGLRFAASLVIATLLGPARYGFWNIIELINKYAPLATLGITSGAKREVPYWKGKNDRELAGKISGVGQFGVAASAMLLALMGIVVGFQFEDTLSRFAIILVATGGGINQIYQYNISIMAANKDFMDFAKFMSLEALVYLLATSVLIYVADIYGLFLAIVFTPALMVFLSRAKMSSYHTVQYDRRIIKRIIRVGAPFMLVGMGYTLLLTINRLFIPTYLGLEQVGYYGFAMLLLTFFDQMNGSIREVLWTHMNEHIGAHERVDTMAHYSVYPSILIALLIPILAGVGILLLPFAVDRLLVEYRPSIFAAQIALIGGAISAGNIDILGPTLRQGLLLIFLGIAILFNSVACIFLLSAGYGINAAAFSMVLGLGVYMLLVSTASLLKMKKRVTKVAKILSITLFYPAVMTTIILLLNTQTSVTLLHQLTFVAISLMVPAVAWMLAAHRKLDIASALAWWVD